MNLNEIDNATMPHLGNLDCLQIHFGSGVISELCCIVRKNKGSFDARNLHG